MFQDYRFMPEPNLLPLNLNAIPGFDLNEIRMNLPESPAQTRESLGGKYNLPEIIVQRFVVRIFTLFKAIPAIHRFDELFRMTVIC